MVANKKNVIGIQNIILILDKITDFSLDQDYQLVKIMKMEIALLPGSIPQMEIVIVFNQVTGPAIVLPHLKKASFFNDPGEVNNSRNMPDCR